MASIISDSLEDFRLKRAELEKDKNLIHDILEKGSKKVSEIANTTIENVRTRMGID